MEGKIPLLFIQPLSDGALELLELVKNQQDPIYELYEVEDVKEALQLIPVVGALVAVLASPTSAATILKEAGRYIKQNKSRILLICPRKLPDDTTVKLTKAGISEIIVEPIIPKNAFFKINLLLKGVAAAATIKNELNTNEKLRVEKGVASSSTFSIESKLETSQNDPLRVINSEEKLVHKNIETINLFEKKPTTDNTKVEATSDLSLFEKPNEESDHIISAGKTLALFDKEDGNEQLVSGKEGLALFENDNSEKIEQNAEKELVEKKNGKKPSIEIDLGLSKNKAELERFNLYTGEIGENKTIKESTRTAFFDPKEENLKPNPSEDSNLEADLSLKEIQSNTLLVTEEPPESASAKKPLFEPQGQEDLPPKKKEAEDISNLYIKEKKIKPLVDEGKTEKKNQGDMELAGSSSQTEALESLELNSEKIEVDPFVDESSEEGLTLKKTQPTNLSLTNDENDDLATLKLENSELDKKNSNTLLEKNDLTLKKINTTPLTLEKNEKKAVSLDLITKKTPLQMKASELQISTIKKGRAPQEKKNKTPKNKEEMELIIQKIPKKKWGEVEIDYKQIYNALQEDLEKVSQEASDGVGAALESAPKEEEVNINETLFNPELNNLDFLIEITNLYYTFSGQPEKILESVRFKIKEQYQATLEFYIWDEKKKIYTNNENEKTLESDIAAIKVPTFSDETFQTDTLQFYYPYYDVVTPLGMAIITNIPKDKISSEKQKILEMIIESTRGVVMSSNTLSTKKDKVRTTDHAHSSSTDKNVSSKTTMDMKTGSGIYSSIKKTVLGFFSWGKK